MTTKKQKQKVDQPSKQQEPDPAYRDAFWSSHPAYTYAFFDKIWWYYADHQDFSPSSIPIDEMYDIGLGPDQETGHISRRLSDVVSIFMPDDPEEFAAWQNNPESKMPFWNFLVQKCEDGRIAERFPPGSAGVITVGQYIHLTDPVPAIKAWSTLLRPGGTLAIWLYGRPVFVPDPHEPSFDHKTCNAIFAELSELVWNFDYGHHLDDQGELQWNNEDQRVIYKRASKMITTGLDVLTFPAKDWKDVERIKTNKHLSSSMWHIYGAENELITWIREEKRSYKNSRGESVTEEVDDDYWSEWKDIEGYKDFVRTMVPPGKYSGDTKRALLPGVGVKRYSFLTVDDLWKRLEAAMGSRGIKRKAIYSSTLVLATRR